MAKILGLSAFYHDSAAAVVVDGEVIAAVQEERFSRKKHDPGFPHAAIEYCLKEARINLQDVDKVVFYDKPFLKFERLLETYLAFAPRGLQSFSTALPVWMKEKIFQKGLLVQELQKTDPKFNAREKLLFTEHHQAHAASAFYPSPFKEALVLTLDGVGEWATTSLSIGKDSQLTTVKEIHFPHSLGLLYSAFTYFCGFKVNSGEYKLMGLAPYGEPKYTNLIVDHLIDIKSDGSFRLNMEYFDYCVGLRMTNKKFADLFEITERDPEDLLTQKHMDIAASIQKVTEDVVCRLVSASMKEYNQKNLCLAGGVALNCVANGKLIKNKLVDRLWIQPAAGDAGGAVGAALSAYHHHLGQPRQVQPQDSMKGSYLGPQFSQSEIEERLTSIGAHYKTLSHEEMIDATASGLTKNKAIGWFQGRMEFGPRALGARSIIADPRSPDMQKTLNLKIKFRESFRPFAPSVLREDVHQYFELDTDSPYMLLVADVQPRLRKELSEEQNQLFGIEKLNISRSEIPAITHVDYSARIQTVEERQNPAYYKLLRRFKEKSGCSVLVNTSFNVRGEPIVCTPEDAFRCFMGTGLDMLVVGNCVLYKDDQDQSLKLDYKNEFTLD